MPGPGELYPEDGTFRVPSPALPVDGACRESPNFAAGPDPLATPDHQPWSGRAMAEPTQLASVSGPPNISPASSTHRDQEGHQQALPREDGALHHDKDISSAIRDAWRESIDEDGTGQNPRWSLYDNIQGLTGEASLTPRQQQQTASPTIPLAPTEHWQGSREQQELEQARARSAALGRGPSITSYGPAPESPAGDDDIRPAPPAPWQAASPPQEGQRVRNGHGPFMHYEDIAYFDSDGEPKDEMEMTAVSQRETLAGLPESTTSRARRSWDRQRTRRQRKRPSPETTSRSPVAGTVSSQGSGSDRLGRQIIAWAPEILWSLLSILCLTIIIVILKIYDGRSFSDQPLSISLSAFIAFIEAICRVSLVVPLTEGLAQLKWNSFAKGDRPLADFSRFDNASRNPVGTASFILRRKGRALGMTAAVALLTCFASSPLTQLSINLLTRFTTGFGTASAPRSELYSHPEHLGTNDGLAPLETEAIQLGFNHPLTATLPPAPPLCSTGDCSYPLFNTLAICSATAEITSHLTLSNPILTTLISAGLSSSDDDIIVHNASLPNGVFLVGAPDSYNLNISSPASQNPNSTTAQGGFLPVTSSLAFSPADARSLTALANIFFIYTNTAGDVSSPRRTFRAVEVLFHFCVNTYGVSVSKGTATTTLVNSTWDVSSITEDVETGSRRLVLKALFDETQYTVVREDARRLSKYLAQNLAGTYAFEFSNSQAVRGGGVRGETAASKALGMGLFAAAGRGTTDLGENGRAVIGNWTGNVATTLTNSIRSAASAATAAQGITLAGEIYFHIQWAWLAFLIAQVALSALFLAGVIIQTAVWRVPVIKGSGSASATLVALSAEDRTHLAGSTQGDEDIGGLGRRLQDVSCRFKPQDRGWGLELVHHDRSGDNNRAGVGRLGNEG